MSVKRFGPKWVLSVVFCAHGFSSVKENFWNIEQVYTFFGFLVMDNIFYISLLGLMIKGC